MDFFNAQGSKYPEAIGYRAVRQIEEYAQTLLNDSKTTYKWKTDGYISFAWKDFKKAKFPKANRSTASYFKDVMDRNYISIDTLNNVRVNPEVLYHQKQSTEWRFDGSEAKTVAQKKRSESLKVKCGRLEHRVKVLELEVVELKNQTESRYNTVQTLLQENGIIKNQLVEQNIRLEALERQAGLTRLLIEKAALMWVDGDGDALSQATRDVFDVDPYTSCTDEQLMAIITQD